MNSLDLEILPDVLAVCRLAPEASIPAEVLSARFCSITRTSEELSLVCPQHLAPAEAISVGGRRCLKVRGPLDFALTGILAGLATLLAQAEISIFAISTYDTDYILIEEKDLRRATEALRTGGHRIHMAGA